MFGSIYAVATQAADWMARGLIAVELLPLHIQLSQSILWASAGVITASLSVKCLRCAASHLNLGIPTFGFAATSPRKRAQDTTIRMVYKNGVRLGSFVGRTMNAMDGEGVQYLGSNGVQATSMVAVEIRDETPFLVKVFSDDVEDGAYYGREHGYGTLEEAEQAAADFVGAAKGYDTRTAWVMNRKGDTITEKIGYGLPAQMGFNGVAPSLLSSSDEPHRASAADLRGTYPPLPL